ncbi:MAG: DUF192 domain-containing protein [Minisyncoccia bacterium]
MQNSAASASAQNGQLPLPQQTISVGTTTILAEIADTPPQLQAGLSGRKALPEGRGMLFVFSQDGNWGFWMPDMHFSIDILWMDASDKILTIAPEVSPKTYPKIFYPSAPARYVLELPAGFASAHGIRVGDTISLPTSG